MKQYQKREGGGERGGREEKERRKIYISIAKAEAEGGRQRKDRQGRQGKRTGKNFFETNSRKGKGEVRPTSQKKETQSQGGF